METKPLKIEQLYTGCLAQGAYYIESQGEAAVIDPLRETAPYLDLARQRGATIKYIFETHFHADFVSGHIDLAKATGAKIIYGPTQAKTGFEHITAFDGQEFALGNVTIKVLHTPGHTLESSCYLLMDELKHPRALFTGDTLFIGDVGRPDLAQHVNSDLNPEKLASMMYDSLQNKIMPLPDEIIVYPGHGAGSACGKNMSNETTDTLGHQKRTNYALRANVSKNDFIKELLTGLTPPPGYFPQNVLMNVKGYTAIDEVIHKATRPVPVDDFTLLKNEKDILVLDTRPAADFARAYIPGSLNIGIDGNFAVWVGTLVKDITQRILFVADKGREEEVAVRLARVGYDNAIGYLEGGIDAWKKAGKEVEEIRSIPVEEFAAIAPDDEKVILDVRKKSEFDSEHVVGAINYPLDYINNNNQTFDRGKTYYVHCAGGYRSMIFVSILRQKGYTNFVNVAGGFNATKQTGKFKLTEYVCPTTML
jgi:glyoxylase-like metal-dependent hydrolase (beta-lactamase superfamily II)/rhodanese-related sulfurtransferase